MSNDEIGTVKAWLDDIVQTAYDLGYMVQKIDPRRVVLVPRGRWDATVTLKTTMLSGKTLRSILVPQEPKA